MCGPIGTSSFVPPGKLKGFTTRQTDFSRQECTFRLDGYCSAVQGLLDWFEVDLGFAELLYIQIDLCVLP